MKYSKLISKILNKSNKIILSSDYKNDFSDKNSFVRRGKLSFSNCIYFILSGLRKSLSYELSDFAKNNKKLKFTVVSKQAFSKARQKIDYRAFKKLCSLTVDMFYKANTKLNTWYGFNVLAVDGTSLQIADTDENIEYFGAYSNQSKTVTTSASASALFDVLNDIIVDVTIGKCHASEREQAIEHINNLNIPKLLCNTVVTFDRGYSSDKLFNVLIDKKLFFLCRLSSSYNVTKSHFSDDIVMKYHQKKSALNLRIIKVTLSDGTIETLVTNIFDDSITPEMFKELYFLRWGIECKYKELKSSLEIEEFSGKKPISIKQDFYASIYLSNITAIIKKDVDLIIESEQSKKKLKYKYQANRNFLLAKIVSYSTSLLIYPRKRIKTLKLILETAKGIKSHIRPGRSNERKKKHPRKTHHSHQKYCL